jgi:cephalosporin hydroxylase
MTSSPEDVLMFDGMCWTDDTVRIGDVTFDLADAHSRRSGSATTRPRLLKDQELVGDYQMAFDHAGEFRARRIFELGLWDGGSAIFWCELAQPDLYIGIDTARPAESQALSAYVASGPATRRVVTRWGVDQSDRAALVALVEELHARPLDLVVDDASHRYAPTLASFEALFPLLRPGGLYVIEEWAWAHWPEYQTPGHAWAKDPSPTRLVAELVEATGSASDVIARLEVLGGLVVAERGSGAVAEPFSLAALVRRRPAPTWLRRARFTASRWSGRAQRIWSKRQ